MHPALMVDMARYKIEELRVDAAVARRAREARKRDGTDGSGPVRTPEAPSPGSERS
ncbi:MAG: hypothetical protein ACRDJJ_00660 [Actinomycetota bacterium]